MKQFIFRKENKLNWEGQRQAIGVALKVAIDTAKGDFVVNVDDYKESSPKALRGYWRLIGLITDYINSSSSSDYKWKPEEISDNFKEQVGHTRLTNTIRFGKNKDVIIDLGGKVKPKSIAKNSGCTYEEISRLIEKLLQFGSEIPDCILTTAEDMEFKKYYGVK